MSKNIYAIYQLKDDYSLREYRFEPLERLKAAGLSVDWGNYNHIYTGTVESGKNIAAVELEKIYMKFNANQPEDFCGHSLSVSDIVVLHRDVKAAAYYVDSFDYTEAPEFLNGQYRYYSTQRPVDIGTYPKTENDFAYFVNFDKRKWVENSTFRAWGYLAYDEPLTRTQINDYELRAASDNPDNLKFSPYQLEAQIEVIGKWEKANNLSDISRITWHYDDMGAFVKKDFVTHGQITNRFNIIAEAKARDAEKVKGVSLDIPAKKHDKSHDDR